MKFEAQESQTLEFKSTIPKNDQIIKTVVGFCNHHGGRIILGINDDATIVGIDDTKIQQTLEYLEQSIYQACSPIIIPRVYTQIFKNKTVLIIEVSSGMNKPYFIKSEGVDKGTYVRIGRTTMRATHDYIDELKWQSKGKSYDTMPLHHATLEELDQQKIQNFLNTRKNKPRTQITHDIMQAYNLAIQEHGQWYPTVAGMLLFGKNPQAHLSESFTITTQFMGTEGREVISYRDCTGTLTEQFYTAFEFILGCLNRSFTIRGGGRRREKLELPETAVREILLNALVHRNYHIPASIKIAIYRDRIEFFSPGNFPGMLNTNNLLQGISYIRNKAICTIFRELGYIEKLGSGLIATFKSYAAYKLKPPTVIEGEQYVKCILPREKAPKKKRMATTQKRRPVTGALKKMSR